MFIKEVNNNGEWAVSCEQGQPCYKELEGAVLLTARRQVALLLPCGTRLRVLREGGGWVFFHTKGGTQPSFALKEEIKKFLNPIWDNWQTSWYCL